MGFVCTPTAAVSVCSSSAQQILSTQQRKNAPETSKERTGDIGSRTAVLAVGRRPTVPWVSRLDACRLTGGCARGHGGLLLCMAVAFVVVPPSLVQSQGVVRLHNSDTGRTIAQPFHWSIPGPGDGTRPIFSCLTRKHIYTAHSTFN